MAAINSTATTTRRPPGRLQSKASEALPTYGMAGGSLSFHEGLKARERGTIDSALAIIGRTLREPGCYFAPRAR